MEQMTSRERVFAAFQGKPHDRIPVMSPVSLATGDCIRHSKAYLPYANLNARKMAALAETSYSLLGFDTVMPYFGVANEVGALGCSINWGNNDRLPKVCGGCLHDLDAFKRPQNYLSRKPIKSIISAIELLKKQVGDQAAIVGKVIGPLSMLFYLYGIQNTWHGLIIEPDKMRHVLEDLQALVVEFALAQIEAGADIITISEDAAGELISRDCYQQIVMPIEEKIHLKLKDNAFTVFHLTSRIMDRVDLFARTGFDAFHFDSRNDLAQVKKMSGDMKLIGCINVPVTLLSGTKEDIANEVYYSIQNGVDMIAPDAAMALQVSNGQLLEILRVVKKYAKQNKC